MKIFVGVMAFLFSIMAIINCQAMTTTVQDSYFINLDNIKQIVCTDKDGGLESGTGTVIGKNRILTANHVIYGSVKCTVGKKEVKIISQYPELDLAVISIDMEEKPSITQISCEGFKENETYFAIGFSKAYDFAMTKLKATGKLKNMDKTEEYPYETKNLVSLNGLAFAGMSGGPIIDMNGRIVGIVNVSNEGRLVGSRSLYDTPLCDALKEPKTEAPKNKLTDEDIKNILNIK